MSKDTSFAQFPKTNQAEGEVLDKKNLLHHVDVLLSQSGSVIKGIELLNKHLTRGDLSPSMEEVKELKTRVTFELKFRLSLSYSASETSGLVKVLQDLATNEFFSRSETSEFLIELIMGHTDKVFGFVESNKHENALKATREYLSVIKVILDAVEANPESKSLLKLKIETFVSSRAAREFTRNNKHGENTGIVDVIIQELANFGVLDSVRMKELCSKKVAAITMMETVTTDGILNDSSGAQMAHLHRESQYVDNDQVETYTKRLVKVFDGL